jgi:hypothetical protein
VTDYQQVGIPSPQAGIGIPSVVDWWLGIGLLVEDETEAAAAPTKTIVKAMMRIVSFIVGNLSWI